MLLALVDCNNFFASCERVFNPKLEGKAIVVLSSNDGCVVARSQEAKKLGIPMGAPAFMYEPLFKKYGVHVFSSNFSLYLDMSRRVMQILKSFTPSIQIYSVDEAFLLLDEQDPEGFATTIRERILAWTGILVSIGIASTKTLSKVANHYAKKGSGVQFLHEKNRKELLEKLPIDEIWGIGYRLTDRLRRQKVYTAWQLQERPDAWLKKELSVVGLRLAYELRGIACLDLEEVRPAKKSIGSAKSFERPLYELEAVQAVLADYTSKVAVELREEGKKASFLKVFLPDGSEATAIFPEPTSYTPTLITYAKKALKTIFRQGEYYKKVGVMLGGFVPEQEGVLDFFQPPSTKKEGVLMKVLDAVNERYGKNSLFFAAAKERSVRCAKRTDRYTTRWDELITVYAS